MAKLGYTWYPKDWGNSESVFELNLSERGLYRELIDLSMQNDNKTEINKTVWCRKFGATLEELDVILDKLLKLKLIIIKGSLLCVPSCENRLNLVRGGSKGGRSSKPPTKPTSKPFESLLENNEKPTSNQIEIETKLKENETEIETKDFSKNELFGKKSLETQTWVETLAMQNKIKGEDVSEYIKTFNAKLLTEMDVKINQKDYASHFSRWLVNEIEKKQKPNQNGTKQGFSTNR